MDSITSKSRGTGPGLDAVLVGRLAPYTPNLLAGTPLTEPLEMAISDVATVSAAVVRGDATSQGQPGAPLLDQLTWRLRAAADHEMLSDLTFRARDGR